jgi:flagella basal body P-ring formation protein FlgA
MKLLKLIAIFTFIITSANAENGLMLKNKVKKGDIIKANNIKIVKFNKRTIPSDLVKDKNLLIGKQALRNINPNIFIRNSFYRIKPAVMEDSEVTIKYQKAGINVEALGIAQQDGKLNDNIKVMNKSSRKIIKAKVIAENIVTVN